MTDPILPIAALVFTPDDQPDALLQRVAGRLAEEGVRLGGVVQHLRLEPGCACEMSLEELASRRIIPISQNLGSGSTSCRLDPAAMAEAASLVRQSMATAPDLFIFNKFGTQELAGSGLRAEMAEVAAAGFPFLTTVRRDHVDAWLGFTGGEGVLLPLDEGAALDWWASLGTRNRETLTLTDQSRKGAAMAYDNQNVFARILRGELPCIKLYEDAHSFAMMDIMPQSDGHLLVLTREPAETIFDMSDEAVQHCILTTRKLAAAAVSALGADGVLISQFNGAAAGQTVPHVHFHVIPRFAGVPMKSHGREREDMARLEDIAGRIIAAL